ncbi:MAG: hypothetical protein LBN93_00015 [Candidatus Symbiothrix sp.]|jgi:hypothetical protein|nr:hypothetical protein [Candidatus Symbiothrix sp.]
MISPEQRKEIIILLKILQDEAKWDKIYAYTKSVLLETDKINYPMMVCEPTATYGYGQAVLPEMWMTEDEAQEMLEEYESWGGGSTLSENQWQEVYEVAEYCEKHPETCHTWEEVKNEVRMKFCHKTQYAYLFD